METSILNFNNKISLNKELNFRNKRLLWKKKLNSPVKGKLCVIILSIVPQVKVVIKLEKNFLTQNLKMNIKCNDNTCL